jgi:glucokinase
MKNVLKFLLVFCVTQNVAASEQHVIGASIASDVTHVVLYKVEGKDKQLTAVQEIKTPTKEILDFTEYFSQIVADLKHQKSPIKVSGVGGAIPGVIDNNKIKFTHIPTPVDGNQIAKEIGVPVILVNDFKAVAQAIAQASSDVSEKKLIIGVGNGFGVAQVVPLQPMPFVDPLNPSCAPFGGRNEQDLKFLNYLRKHQGGDAWGKVLGAGGGILRVYDFLHEKNSNRKKYTNYLDIFEDAKKLDHEAQQAVDYFMNLYGYAVQGLLMHHVPKGGIYLTNTIAQNYPELFASGSVFMNAVMDLSGTTNAAGKEYLNNILNQVPVHVVADSYQNLLTLGAAWYALQAK